MSKFSKYYIYFVCLVCLTACNQGLTVKTEAVLPTPLTAQHPLKIGVFYEDALKQYIYTENSEDRENWSISIGDSQIQLFNKILPPLFTQVDIVNSNRSKQHDAIFIPKLVDIQFALPEETQINFYEVWVKYQMHILDPNQNTITILPFSGYGKSKTKFINDEEAGIQAAARQAYRTAGAKFILEFESNPEIKQWLVNNS